ncbi:MAG: CubicO group peptidase (beta-lactamase class C family) [Cryomorphaceae bacterium]|jgi:CubicO group peptidase (beta-lactamase class C family)
MKIIKKLLVALVALSAIGVALLYVSGHGYIITALQGTYLAGNVTANVNDYTEFKVSKILTSTSTILPKHQDYNSKPLAAEFTAELEKYGTVSFLVVKDGQVLSETYMNGYDDRSKTNSFSMAKTVATLLLGIAIEEGHVKSLNQPITDFLPEFASDRIGSKATIGQLSLMTSGYEWTEHYYSPLSPTVELLYGDDVEEFLLKGEFNAEPGSFWEYSSASSELMGVFLTRALQKAGAAQSLSEYLSKRIWQPMQMNDDALWHQDDKQMELVFCCLNTNARNFAKLGLLMLNQGRWNDQQLVPAPFVEQMIQPVGKPYYGLSTWLSPETSPSYYWMSGHLGQYIVVIPEHNMVVVRLGETRNPDKDFRTETLPEYIQAAMDLL